MREGKPFPWRALYRALVRRIAELDDQRPHRHLASEIAVLAEVHAEVLERGQRHDDD